MLTYKRKVVDFKKARENLPHRVEELWCNNCGKVTINVIREGLDLDLTCPNCGKTMKYFDDVEKCDIIYFISKLSQSKEINNKVDLIDHE